MRMESKAKLVALLGILTASRVAPMLLITSHHITVVMAKIIPTAFLSFVPSSSHKTLSPDSVSSVMKEHHFSLDPVQIVPW